MFDGELQHVADSFVQIGDTFRGEFISRLEGINACAEERFRRVDVSQAEHFGLIEQHAIIPVVHIPELYALNGRVGSWNGSIVQPTGAWDLANVWLGADRP